MPCWCEEKVKFIFNDTFRIKFSLKKQYQNINSKLYQKKMHCSLISDMNF